jgi:hypothetical protein
MPRTEQDIEKLDGVWVPMSPGEVRVNAGQHAAMIWREPIIPLDGRQFNCAGRIILRSGQELPANFSILTHLCFLLDQSSTICRIGTTWYGVNEPELYETLGITREQALPFHWLPDRPLDCEDQDPYRMDWGFLRKRELVKQMKPMEGKLNHRSRVEDYPMLACCLGMLLYGFLLRTLTDWPFFAVMAVAPLLSLATLAIIAWLEIRRIRRQ